MILLAIASCLLFFITYFTGILTTNFLTSFFKTGLNPNFFETFALGLIACFVYFNLLSFFLPVNYFALILPMLGAFLLSPKNR